MAQDGILKTNLLDKRVIDSLSQDTNLSDAYERMKAELHRGLGVPTPVQLIEQSVDAYAAPASAAIPGPTMPVSAGEPKSVRVLYLHGNDRIIIYGASESELDAHEARLRTLYSGGN